MRIFVAITLMLFLVTAAIAEKRAFTIADLYKLKTIESPAISPDGKRIAFTVREDDLEKGKGNTDLYVMNVDGSNIRRMTSDPAADTAPKWSSDGKSILFTSTRKDGSQAWMIPADGGEATQLTTFAMEVDNLDWVPDGKRIVFSTSVYPECAADNDCNKKNEDGLNNGPLAAHMADRLLYRHWTSWRDGKYSHTFVYDIASKKYVDLTPGEFDWPAIFYRWWRFSCIA